VIAPVEALPGKISAYVQHVPLIAKPGRLGEYTAQSALEKVALFPAYTGVPEPHFQRHQVSEGERP